MFFCKYNDPVYVKLEKVDIMVMLVSERNYEQVLLELKEYASGVDVDFVRKSVRSIGRVAVKLERACERAIGVLLELIETKVNYVVQEASVVVKDIFRKYPSRYEQVLSALCDSLEVLDEPEAKASMIWILGEYAERIDNVDELLDSFLANFHDEPAMVQMQLLTGIVKLFLKKPQTTQDMVSKVLKYATEESNNHDIRDRGYIYWRLLSTNPEATKHVVLGDKPPIRDDSQTIERNLLDKLISDLALMSSVYHKSQEEFVTRIASAAPRAEGDVQDDEEYDEEDRQARRREVQQELERGPDREERPNGSGHPREAPSGGGGGAADLLDLGGIGDEPVSSPAPAMPQKQPVLSASSPSQNGRTGFAVSACLCRQSSAMQLQMSFVNASPAPLTGFAIQVNKNPFGIGPGQALQVPDIAPNASADVSLPMLPGQLPNNQAPSNPLFLQVAIKNSLDVFYFNMNFELPAVLLEAGALNQGQFTEIWRRVSGAGQHTMMVNCDRPMNPDTVRSKLAFDNIHFVGRKQDGDSTVIYTSATTTNNCPILAELEVGSSSSIKVTTKTETPVLVPLFEAAVAKRLGGR